MGFRWLLSFANTIVLEKPAGGESRASTEPKKVVNYGFEMPLHYPRYVRSDYEKMNEEQLDLLLHQYGLNFEGDLEDKRKFAIGAFLWPDHF